VTEADGWDEESRSWALALAQYEAGLCPACGQPMSVCQAPENEGMFEAEPPIRCFSKTALVKFQDGYEQDPALLWTAAQLRSG